MITKGPKCVGIEEITSKFDDNEEQEELQTTVKATLVCDSKSSAQLHLWESPLLSRFGDSNRKA